MRTPGRWRYGSTATPVADLSTRPDGTPINMLLAAAHVHCGNRELTPAGAIAADIVELSVRERASTRSGFRTPKKVFTFGMATRFACRSIGGCATCWRRQEKAIPSMSTALHENTSFDGLFVVRFEELQPIFNGQVYFMGYLSDTAVFNHLMDCTSSPRFSRKACAPTTRR